MCFNVKNECIKKKFQKGNTRDFLNEEHNLGIYFLGIFLGCYFKKNTSNTKLLDVFYR